MSHTAEMMAMIDAEVKPLLSKIAALERQLDRRAHSVKEWTVSCDFWRERCNELTAALEKAKIPHTVCDDCWYTCPKATEDRCCNTELAKDKCICGADIHNAAIDAVIKRYTP